MVGEDLSPGPGRRGPNGVQPWHTRPMEERSGCPGHFAAAPRRRPGRRPRRRRAHLPRRSPRRTEAVLRHLRFRDLRYVCPARDVTRRGTPTAQVRNTGPPTVYVTVDGRGEAVPEAPAALLLHGPYLRTPWYPSGSLLCERARVGRVTDCHAVSPKTLFARAEDDRDQDVSRKPDRPQSAGSTTCVPPPVSSTRCSRMLSDRAVLVRIGRLRGRDPQPAVTAAESSEVR